MLDDFKTAEIRTSETSIFVRWSGSGSPILLLHGFPQTHLMWRSVAPLLARNFTVVCADLRGYGRSGCPVSTPDHAPYAKRAMAQDMVIVMERLGFPRFSVAGHDRGGRVAYRMALDHTAGRRIASPLLALWSARGALDTWYAEAAGPIALWRAWSDDVQGHPLDAGHFFPEEAPEQTADALNRFFAQTGSTDQ
jgi:pimeloyl-ACP methyl ester carboxylesterase